MEKCSDTDMLREHDRLCGVIGLWSWRLRAGLAPATANVEPIASTIVTG